MLTKPFIIYMRRTKMIYLRFPEDITGRIEGATILKPSFEVSITEILSRTYQPEIVKRYAEQISDFIYNNMEFPEDGIYRIEAEEIWHFDEKRNTWRDTKKKVANYVISENSPLWDCFDGEFKFLKKVCGSIKSAVKAITEEMFGPTKWIGVSSIDTRDYQIFEAKYDKISKVLKTFFTGGAVSELHAEIQRIVYEGVQESGVMIIADGQAKSVLYKDHVKQLSEKVFNKVEEALAEWLQPEEAKRLSLTLKNALLFSLNNGDFEIVRMGYDGRRYCKYKGIEVVIDENGVKYIEIDEQFLQSIQGVLCSKKIYTGRYGNSDIEIDGESEKNTFTLHDYNGIVCRIEEYYGTLRLESQDVSHYFNSCEGRILTVKEKILSEEKERYLLKVEWNDEEASKIKGMLVRIR